MRRASPISRQPCVPARHRSRPRPEGIGRIVWRLQRARRPLRQSSATTITSARRKSSVSSRVSISSVDIGEVISNPGMPAAASASASAMVAQQAPSAPAATSFVRSPATCATWHAGEARHPPPGTSQHQCNIGIEHIEIENERRSSDLIAPHDPACLGACICYHGSNAIKGSTAKSLLTVE